MWFSKIHSAQIKEKIIYRDASGTTIITLKGTVTPTMRLM